MSAKSHENYSKMGQLGVQLGTQEVRRFRGFRLLGPSMFRFRVFVVFCGLLGASWDHLGTNLWQFWDHFGTILEPFCAIFGPMSSSTSLSCLSSLL